MDTTERNALLSERRSLVEEIMQLRTRLAGIDAGLAEPDVAKVRENDLTLVYATLSEPAEKAHYAKMLARAAGASYHGIVSGMDTAVRVAASPGPSVAAITASDASHAVSRYQTLAGGLGSVLQRIVTIPAPGT